MKTGRPPDMLLTLSDDPDDWLTVTVARLELPPALYNIQRLDSGGAEVVAGGRTYRGDGGSLAGFPGAGVYRLRVVPSNRDGGYSYGSRRFSSFEEFDKWFAADIETDKQELAAAMAKQAERKAVENG